MAFVVLPNGRNQFVTETGAPAVGYKVYAYVAGTSTPKDTYTDYAGGTANTHPIVLDARGEAAIYWSGTYDVVLKDPAGVTIWGPERVVEPASEAALTGFAADLASASDVSLGDALIGVKRTDAGAVATTQHIVNEYRPLNAIADYAATGDGSTDDTSELQALLDSGNKNILIPPGNYKISSTLLVKTDGQYIKGYGATITASAKTVGGLRIGWSGSTFTKTDDITIEGLSFVGVQDGSGSSPSYAISVDGPSADPYVKGDGCSRVKLISVKASGHTGGFAATAADNVVIDNSCYFGDMEYLSSLTAGGYGVLLQTCFDSEVSGHFVGSSGDRHAIYISADPSRTFDNNNVCKGITLKAPSIDWTGVTSITGGEAAVVARAPELFSWVGGVVRGGYGGFDYAGENGNGRGISIHGVSFADQTSSGSERACINFVAGGGYICTGVSITGCTMVVDGTNLHNIALIGVDSVSIVGNVMRNTDGVSCINVAGSVTNLVTSGNRLYGNTLAGAVYRFLSTSNSDIEIGKDKVTLSGGSAKLSFVTTPSSLTFSYVRSAIVRANSTGSPVILSDPDGIIASVATDANGITPTFSAQISDVSALNTSFALSNSSVCTAYYRSSASQAVTIGVADFAGGALGAATNTYDIAIFLAH